MTQYCPECRCVVHKFDLGKRLHHGVNYHGPCLVKYLTRVRDLVHNHGIDPSCRETRVNGRLRGECLDKPQKEP